MDLPPLQEAEIIAGDWLTLVGPYMRDISSTSHMWWDQCVAIAGAAYQQWLLVEPLRTLLENEELIVNARIHKP